MPCTLVLLPALALAAGCAASTYPLNPMNSRLAAQVGLESPAGADPKVSTPVVQQGVCSWYGPGFQGRRTSNGEVFDTNELTAAHPTLPFDSQVEVTNVRSGRRVRVRINDRGPFVGRRILDLSRAAAESIGIVNQGVAEVHIRLVDVHDADWSEDVYALEVASFQEWEDAEDFLHGLDDAQRALGLYYVKHPDGDGTGYDVRFGPFGRETAARRVAKKLRRLGLEPRLVEEDLSATLPVDDEADVGRPERMAHEPDGESDETNQVPAPSAS